MDSIDKVVQRGDKLELLQDRSDQLVMESDRQAAVACLY